MQLHFDHIHNVLNVSYYVGCSMVILDLLITLHSMGKLQLVEEVISMFFFFNRCLYNLCVYTYIITMKLSTCLGCEQRKACPYSNWAH